MGGGKCGAVGGTCVGWIAEALRRIRQGAVPAVILAVSIVLPRAAMGQDITVPPIPRTVPDVEKNHVGIITGAPAGVYAKMGNDMLRLLDDRKNNSLRLSVLIGTGSLANLDDLRNLPGVSMAIVQGDVLDAYAHNADNKWMKETFQYVTRLHNEVLHIITRKDVIGQTGSATICALRGKRINVGGPKSGAVITAKIVLNDTLGLGVTLDPGSLDVAFDQLANKSVDAIFYVVGKPADQFSRAGLSDQFSKNNFEFLSAPLELLSQGCPGAGKSGQSGSFVYEEATLTHKDYPQLIDPRTVIKTLSAPAVLAAFNFKSTSSDRARSITEFAKQLIEKGVDAATGFANPKEGFNPNWCSVDLAVPVSNWTRLQAVDTWLAMNRKEPHPLPTSIQCNQRDVEFCSTPELKVKEFNRRLNASGSRLNSTDQRYSMELLEFVKKECP